MNDDQAKSQGLPDTLALAQAYSQPGATQDLPKACYLYARVLDFAPPQFKAQIEPKLNYYYKRYHGNLDGLDALKEQAKGENCLRGPSISLRRRLPRSRFTICSQARPT